MRNFKGTLMSEYTSKLTILRDFLKIFSMIHMPHKPIASASFDINIIFMQEMNISNQNIHPNSSILFHFFKIFSKKYISHKPLAIKHRAAPSISHG